MITREEAKELLPILQAFAEGKQIQDKIEGLTDWVDTNEINFVYKGQRIQHRIKPELEYRPFKNQEECWNEMLKHQPFGWVINKTDKHFYLINFIYDCKQNNGYGIRLSHYQFSDITLDYESILKDYEFADEKPFGIKEE